MSCSLAAGKASSTSTDGEWKLSEKDRESYQKAFSSILVPYTSLEVANEIGQGTSCTFHCA